MAQNKPEKQAESPALKSSVALREEETLSFWDKNKIFQKSLTQNEGGKEFVFYDGPPFATGLPHYGHLLPGTMKDVIPRFQTMRGHYVRRQWGWDCHGLPVENLIEKELNLGSKIDIEKYGVEKFNRAARNAVLRYVDDWKKIIPRTGRWVDMDAAYKTMDPSYTESVWWSFKQLSEKGLVYEGFKSMQICPRCETTLSNFEVNQGYKDIVDISVYVKFELVDAAKALGLNGAAGAEKAYMLAWTTTPWTLPGNVALAVNADTDYVLVETASAEKTNDTDHAPANLILAKARLGVLKGEYKILKELKGRALVGLSYKPIFDYYSSDKKLKDRDNGWKIYNAAFVETNEGTGIVHIAPAFGAEDMELARVENIPFVQHIGIDGRFKKEVTDFAGLQAKPIDTKEEPQAHQRTDIEIIKYLAHHHILFAKEKITHSYPHCWRCDTPLLNYATSSWFIEVTDLKDRLVTENKKVNWTPASIRDGRFGNWLEGAKDWAISRSRYWGAPIPVWKCSKCDCVDTIGSLAELRSKIKPRNTYYVMRHGEADNNIQQIIGANLHTYHLTHHGEDQALRSAQKLVGKGIDLIITSPFNRTRETGEIVRKTLGLTQHHMLTSPDLHEVNAGIFNDKPISLYHAYFTSPEEQYIKAPPEGESHLEVRQRMGKFIYDIDQKYSGRTILIVTHDTPVWLLKSLVSGWDQRETLAIRNFGQKFFNNAEVQHLDFVPFPHNEFFETDLHRPYIDEVTYPCQKCGGKDGSGGTMKRVPDVLDTWYDSGSMPFARSHYPFDKSKFDPKSIPLFKKSHGFPADFIAEGLDQTRGWFYTLLVMSVGLFDKTPYKNVVVNGLILAEDGKKMSKSLKNFPELMPVIDKYGADALRYYLMSSPAVHAEDFNFSEKGVDEVYKKMILRFENVLSFYELQAKESDKKKSANPHPSSKNVLDIWIDMRLRQTATEVTKALENYQIDRGAWPLESFLDDLSTWYIRRSRDRFKNDDVEDRKAALATIRFILVQFSKIAAPYMPFIAETVYQKVRGTNDPESVHLTVWPEGFPEVGKSGHDMILQMTEVRKLVTLGLEARVKANIKVRQPLSEFKIKTPKSGPHVAPQLSEEFLAVIADELNVKKVSYANIEAAIELDATLTPELKLEGQFRELLRAIQDLRKQENLAPSDIVSLEYSGDSDVQNTFASYGPRLKKLANLKDITHVSGEGTALSLKLIK